MQHNTERGQTEKIVAPSDVARLLHNQPFTWGSGILTPNTLFVGESAGYRVVVEYRKPQMTGIWLEGSDDPVRLPMPGLILIRWLAPQQPVSYNIFAVKSKPNKLSVKLFAAPLPNTYSSGDICWGNVARPTGKKSSSVALDADWKLLLGSRFNSHSVQGKSKKHNDIRKLLVELDSKKVKQYPVDDLVETGKTLELAINGKEKSR